MHFKFTKIGCSVLLFLMFSFTYSCKPAPEHFEDKKYTDHILSLVSAVEDTLDYHRALFIIDSSINGKLLSPNDKYRIFHYKEYIYQNKLGDMAHALQNADSMLWIVSNNQLSDWGEKKFNTHKMLADVYYAMEQFKPAYENYEIAKSIADTVQSPYVRSKFFFSLGMANYREGRYLESARLFTKASARVVTASLLDDQAIDFYQQEVLANAGLAYAMANMPDSSMYFYRYAIRFIQNHKQMYPAKAQRWDEAISIVYGNLADLHKKLGNRDSAGYYFTNSIAINRLSGRNIKDREYNIIKLADLYLDKKDFAKAHALLDEVQQSSHRDSVRSSPKDSLEFSYRLSQVLSRYYDNTGNHQLAFVYLQQHHNAQERKWSMMQKGIVNNLEAGISNAGNEKQIMVLSTGNKIRNQRIAILILLCLVSVSGFMIIYYNMRLHKTNSKILQLKNEQILSESNQKQEQLQRKMDTDRSNYLSLLENTDDCLWSLDKDLKILAFNNVYKEFIKLVSGKVPKVGDKDILEEIDSKFYANILAGYQSALSGTTFNSIDKGIKTGNSNLDFAMRFHPMKDDKGEIVGITCSRKDITEYFSLIDSLQKNTEQFKNIAWIQSHALRGPLTTMMGIAILLSDDQDDIDKASNKELIKGMKEKLEQMDKIVKDIVKLTY